jgi:hypothetical protein
VIVLAHENGRVRIVEQIAGEVRQLHVMTSAARSACRCVGTRTAKPGEARSAVTKFHAAGALHDPRVGCHAQKLVEAPALRRRMHGHRHGLSERCERRFKLFEPRGMVESE